jgi:hypothetical protein
VHSPASTVADTMPTPASRRAPSPGIPRLSPFHQRQCMPLIRSHAELFDFQLVALPRSRAQTDYQMLRLLHGNSVLHEDIFDGKDNTRSSGVHLTAVILCAAHIRDKP